MNVSGKIARRYFTSRRHLQSVNIITRISVGAIALSAAAMITILSVFNGMEGIIKSMYTAFYPDLKISARTGKFFEIPPGLLKTIRSANGVQQVSYSLEDMVLIEGDDHQRTAMVKGVSDDWFAVNGLNPYIKSGNTAVDRQISDSAYAGVIGYNLAAELGLNVNTDENMSSFSVYYPLPGADAATDPRNALNQLLIYPTGIFRVQPDFDNKYILTGLNTARNLFSQDTSSCSSIEIKLKQGFTARKVASEWLQQLPGNLKTETRYEQNKELYMIMTTEKWSVYGVLILVLVIASFNLVGALAMLAMEKKKDIIILKSMGLPSGSVRGIILKEGVLLSCAGAVWGLVLGTLLCVGQQHFGWIKMGQGFVIDAYPVAIHWQDYLLVTATILLIGFLAAVAPALKAGRQAILLREA